MTARIEFFSILLEIRKRKTEKNQSPPLGTKGKFRQAPRKNSPTKSEDDLITNGVDFRLKERIAICKKPKSFNLGF
jgi:hypothetical protein